MPTSRSRKPLIQKLLTRGKGYQREGRRELADECYRHALTVDPRCSEALRLRELVAKKADGDSTAYTGSALVLSPDDPIALTSLAKSCLDRSEKESALANYRRVAQMCPESAEAHGNLGQAEEVLGDLEAAARCYRRGLELQADSAEISCKLSDVLRRQNKLPEALRLCRYALTLDPGRFETHRDLGVVLTEMKDFGAAAEAFQRSMALKPDCARTALTLSYFNFRRGDLPAAAESARHAVELEPSMHLAHLAVGSIAGHLGDRTEALKCYERALELCPNSSEVIFYLGLLHLLEGNCALGWKEYEEREEARCLRRIHPQPQWKGEPLEGARIFLHAEQGLGDTLQFIRYVPLVAARGGQVVLAVQPRLHRLLAGTDGAWQVISDGGTVSDFRWQCPLLSLPLAFGTDLNTIPAKVPYVHPDPALVQVWKQRLQGNALRIGLAWAGDPKQVNDLRRSMSLEQLAPLTHLASTTFYSLQMGPPAEQLKQLSSRVRLVDLQDEQKDFADTAAIVANLDLVISVDTAVAHLAGAMGTPVWVLLHKSSDWRWLLDREDSPWYPTARLFRQSTLGNWPEVVGRVHGELRELVASTAAAAGAEPSAGAASSAGLSLDWSEADTARPPGQQTLHQGEESTFTGGHSVPKQLQLHPQVRKLLSKGIKHHQAGRRERAQAYYQRSLKFDPRCAQAFHLLSLLAQQAGQVEEAIQLLGQALAANPNDSDALKSLADAHIGQGQIQMASDCLQRLTELDPQSAETHHRLGSAQERLGNWEAASTSYGRALALEPDSPDRHRSLASLQYKQAAFAESAQTCRRALALDPNRHDIHTQLGNALTDLGNYGGAVEALRCALALKPDSALAVFSLGYFFEKKGDLASAADAFRNALQLNPELDGAHLHLGIIHILQANFGEAAECFERALELTPNIPEARSFLGLIHLAQGNYSLGWSEYEDRRGTAQFLRNRRSFPQPIWKGEPLEGSRILLYAEQGLGDTLQFVRYVPLVAARGGKVILEVRPACIACWLTPRERGR